MAKMVKVTGVQKIIGKLLETDIRLGQATRRGLIRAGLYLQRESQQIVPVQLGNLKNSAGTKAIGAGWLTDVVVYYTADYAVYVHENPDAVHGKDFNVKYAEKIARAHTPAQRKIWFSRGVNQVYKFLETPAREKRAQILAIIASSAGNI